MRNLVSIRTYINNVEGLVDGLFGIKGESSIDFSRDFAGNDF